MSFREKSAWITAGTLSLALLGYLVAVLGQIDGRSVDQLTYQVPAAVAAVGFIAATAAGHSLLAILSREPRRPNDEASRAIRRYARSAGAGVVLSAAVIGMVLAMLEVADFWIANVLLMGIGVAEVWAATSEIISYRRGM